MPEGKVGYNPSRYIETVRPEGHTATIASNKPCTLRTSPKPYWKRYGATCIMMVLCPPVIVLVSMTAKMKAVKRRKEINESTAYV